MCNGLRSACNLYVALLASAALCLMNHAKATEQILVPEPTHLVFGVLNQQSAIQTAQRWNPILRYLSQKVGIPIKLKMGATVELTDAMLGREEFDLAFTNHNFQSEYDGKYRVLVHWAGTPIRGVIVTHEDSPIRSLKDLQGKVVAFPSYDAFLAYAVPLVALKEAGISVVSKFSGHQDGALAQLKAGLVDAAAVNSRFIEPYAIREGIRFAIVFTSEPFHELPIVIHPRIASETVKAIKHALLGMNNDPAGSAILKESNCPGFESADDHDYNNVRQIYRLIGQ